MVKFLKLTFLDSSMVERLAVNEMVVGSNPTPGASWLGFSAIAFSIFGATIYT